MIKPLLAPICRRILEFLLIIAAGATVLAAWVPRVLGRRAAPSSRHKGTPPKPPRALGIVFAEPELANVSLQGVANLACWAADLGIQYVYLYDPAGHLKRSQVLLESILEVQSAQHGITAACQVGWAGLQEKLEAAIDRKQQLSVKQQQVQMQMHRWLQEEHQQLPVQRQQEQQGLGQQQAALEPQQWQQQNVHAQQPTTTTAQITAGSRPTGSNSHHITVHVLGPDDSWSPLLAVARQLPQQLRGGSPRHSTHAQAMANGIGCELKQNGTADQATPALGRMDLGRSPCKPDVYAEMAAAAGPAIVREPQLLLVYGPVLTLAGYPPFHTRSCEIYHMGPMCLARREQLAAMLALYCRATLQRHGT